MSAMNYEAGIYKVIDAHALEAETRNGWQLVGSVQHEVTEKVYHTGIVPGGSGGSYSTQIETPVMRKEWRYLVRFAEGSALELAAKEVADLREKYEHANKDIENREKKIKELAGQENAVREKLIVATTVLEKETAKRKYAEGLAQKMEADIAKVREAIGSVRMREILGE